MTFSERFVNSTAHVVRISCESIFISHAVVLPAGSLATTAAAFVVFAGVASFGFGALVASVGADVLAAFAGRVPIFALLHVVCHED